MQFLWNLYELLGQSPFLVLIVPITLPCLAGAIPGFLERRRRRQLEEALPEVLESISSSIGAGLGLQQALTETSVQAVHSLPQPIFDQAHIPSSVCQPCTDFLQDGVSLLPDEELKERLVANNEVGKTITYCGGGVAATVNAIVCRLVGNPDVSVYDGSMSEWVGEGLPVESNS